MEFESHSDRETYQLGRDLGRKAQPGQVICLNGDLGTGKTVFTKGFAEILNAFVILLIHPLLKLMHDFRILIDLILTLEVIVGIEPMGDSRSSGSVGYRHPHRAV